MTSTSIQDGLELLIHLERRGKPSLQRQLLEQVRRAILQGQLAPGRRLPSTRALAESLGISRNIVVAVYEELWSEGYLIQRRGSGTSVADDLPSLPLPPRPAPAGTPRWLPQRPTALGISCPLPPDVIAFQPGGVVIAPLPLGVWNAVWKEATACLPPTAIGPTAGDLELRAALADYLRRTRGVPCGAEDVLLTASAMQALELIARVTLRPGDLAGIEEPGYPIARHLFGTRGAQIVTTPVDADGLRVDALPGGSSAPLVQYVTPSHQFPLGGRLPIARRLALLEWASANDSLIIEDDYDSEFRFDAPPLPALAGLDQEGRVAYIGTFSKVLTPALRLGYLVAPAPLRQQIVLLKRLGDQHPSWPTQRALLAFIRDGHLERHIRRMRRHYAEKRALLSKTLAPISHLAQLRGLEAGLHVFLELRPGLDARRIAQAAFARGVVVTLLDAFYAGKPDRGGFLVGYGGLEPEKIVRGARILAEVIEQEQ
ncbi:MAG TPA: PLP-dependent aminotransferase family protein [Ktedonobacterales bacterium]|jgi:GntR family transcriptional regulator/MocR family aminotransferase